MKIQYENMVSDVEDAVVDSPTTERRKEYKALFIVVVLLFPIVTISLISGYGFLVWFSQMIFGPPGHG
ncbi:periplasmic nitrate reductase, NapE protein [Endozoicomonas ascidiicola]|uniref:periplasmic nitrate reductase, NapE protein n=2 Tax=Endozoicomonas ascidiicola TaxID=1698521 RepID=UPI000AA82902